MWFALQKYFSYQIAIVMFQVHAFIIIRTWQK